MSELWCKDTRKHLIHICTEMQKCNTHKSMFMLKFCNFAYRTLSWWGIKGNSSDSAVIQQWFSTTLSVNDKPTSGCHRITTASATQDWYIGVHYLRNRTIRGSTTVTQIAGLSKIFNRTVRNQVRKVGISPRRPVWHNAVPAEGEMGTCQVKDCFVLRWVSFSSVTCW